MPKGSLVRYDLKLVHELCGELGLRSRIVSDESVPYGTGQEGKTGCWPCGAMSALLSRHRVQNEI
jgi:hypothetical protein